MRSILGIVLCAMGVDAASAGDLKFEVAVDAGGIARKNSPVHLDLRVGKEIPAEAAAKLPARLRAGLEAAGDKKGAEPAAQAVVEKDEKGSVRGISVIWIEKSLDAAEKRVYRLALSETPPESTKEDFRFVDAEGYRDWFRGDVPVLRHMTAFDPVRREDTYKPYHHVYGFHADGFITKGPGGKYPHHRGIFMGWNKTSSGGKTWDFWHCPAAANVHQRHAKFLPERETLGPVAARAASLTDWVDPSGKPVVRDRREVTAWWQPEAQLLLDIDVLIEPLAGDTRLDGDPQHAGLQFRAAQEVAEREKETVYVLPEGAVRDKSDVVTKCPWAACIFKIQGKPYAVMQMSHPDEAAGAVYSTRDYGRFGAFAPHDVNSGQPLRLRYRLLILDTEKHPDVTRERFQRKYEDYARPLLASVSG